MSRERNLIIVFLFFVTADDSIGNGDDSDTAKNTTEPANTTGNETSAAAATATTERTPSLPKWRQHYCSVCRKWQSQLVRHLQRKHSTHPDVIQMMNDKSREVRRKAALKLRYRGFELYNKHKNPNQPLRFPKTSVTGERVPCVHCKVLLKKTSRAKHFLICPQKPPPPPPPTIEPESHHWQSPSSSSSAAAAAENLVEKNCRRIGVSEGRQALMHLAQTVSTETGDIPVQTKPSNCLIKFGSSLRNDTARAFLFTDELLVDYGNLLCAEKRTELGDRGDIIRRKLSILVDLVLRMKKRVPTVTKSQDLLNVDNWDALVQATCEKAGWSQSYREFRAPSMVKHIAVEISDFAHHVAGYAILKKNNDLKERSASFLLLKKARFQKEIGKSAVICGRKKRWLKRKVLPLTSDIKILDVFLRRQIAESLEKLNRSYDEAAWVQLNKVVIVQIVFFNRRRIGDVMKSTIKDFEARHSIQSGTAVYDSLNPYEKTQAEKFVRMEVQGKGARAVGLLISHEQVTAIEMILKFRQEAHVGRSNRFLFATGKSGYFHGHQAMHYAMYNCGAAEPATLSGTNMRKHMASTVQALNMTDTELSLLAEFMGHTDKTHKQYYRLPSDVAQLTIVASLLTLVHEGKVPEFRGRSLNDVIRSLDNLEDPDEVVRQFVPSDPPPTPTTTPSIQYDDFPSPLPPSSPPPPPPQPSPPPPPPHSSSFVESFAPSPIQRPASTAPLTPAENTSSLKGKEKKRWTTAQKTAVIRAYPEAVNAPYTMPSRANIAHFKANNADNFEHRTVEQIAAWIYNNKNSKQRQEQNQNI